ncbi:MAG: HPr family phosphocarrier protein [Lachnospiraceae bacterium]|nr:HPr family phosphocarrier protein [Lachnospiraceae bacterium]
MFQVVLNNPNEVKEFVETASKSSREINLESGSVFIDAKSFLGVLTMGINRKMSVRVIGEDNDFIHKIQKFAIA